MDRNSVRSQLAGGIAHEDTPARWAWRFTSGLASRLTLVQRFALISLIILVTGAIIIGRFVAEEIEDGVTARSSAITALYVDSFISPHLQDLGGGTVSEDTRRELDRLLIESSLGRLFGITGILMQHDDLKGSRHGLMGKTQDSTD